MWLEAAVGSPSLLWEGSKPPMGGLQASKPDLDMAECSECSSGGTACSGIYHEPAAVVNVVHVMTQLMLKAALRSRYH